VDAEHGRHAWMANDLSCFVENRLNLVVAPEHVRNPEHAEALRLATCDALPAPSQHLDTLLPAWLHDGGKRAGSVALDRFSSQSTTLRVSSLYVSPKHRGRSLARQTLQAIQTAGIHAGFRGLRLSTQWSWQRTLGLYLRMRFWVWGWRHEMDLTWSTDLPSWDVEWDGDQARFVVVREGVRTVAIHARNLGERLAWTPMATHAAIPEESAGTFAAVLATRGWPLITSEAAWQKQLDQGFSERGGPEGLAFRITQFEAWDRKQGWAVNALPIPGLVYPAWQFE